MAASLAELVIRGGIRELHCPVTGRPVFTEEDGFDPALADTPYLRFFVDWAAEIFVARPDDLPPDEADYQKAVIGLMKSPGELTTQLALMHKCRDLLPASAIILEILNPPEGSFDGDICYACFDLSQAETLPEAIRLVHIDEVE